MSTASIATLTNKTLSSPTINGTLNCGQAAVAQTTSNSTSVTINSSSGVITMFGALNAGFTATFTVNNTSCTANSIIIATVCQATLPLDAGVGFTVWAGNATAGSFKIQVYNNLASNATRPAIINFLVC